MSRLILLCGLPGCGKTTLARSLERDLPALRLSPDEWIEPLLIATGADLHSEPLRDTVEALQWGLAARALVLGFAVILENGFWSREERARYRVRGQELGAIVELRFLDVPRDELWTRLERRNAELPPGSFPVREDQLDLWLGWFEAPTPQELRQFSNDKETS